MSAPSGGASPATSAAPLVAAYEHSAAVGSAVVDAWDRRPFVNGGKRGATSTTEPSSDGDEDKEKIAAAMGGAAAAGVATVVLVELVVTLSVRTTPTLVYRVQVALGIPVRLRVDL